LADLNPVRGREQAGLRPALFLSHDLFNRKSETAIAMARSCLDIHPNAAARVKHFETPGMRVY